MYLYVINKIVDWYCDGTECHAMYVCQTLDSAMEKIDECKKYVIEGCFDGMEECDLNIDTSRDGRKIFIDDDRTYVTLSIESVLLI